VLHRLLLTETQLFFLHQPHWQGSRGSLSSYRASALTSPLGCRCPAGRLERNLVMLRRFRILAVAALILAIVAPGLPAAAAASGVSGPTVTSDERGCTEAAYYRRGLEAAVRPLVPEQYTPEVALVDKEGRSIVVLLINEVVCQQVITGGVRVRGPVVTVIVSVRVTLPDGTEDFYVLFYATDNPIQFAAFKRFGWPVELLKKASTGTVTRDASGQITSMHLTVMGAGAGARAWDHELTLLRGDAPVSEPEQAPGLYYRDVDGTQLKLCYAMNIGVARPVTVSANLAQTPLPSITPGPRLNQNFTIPGTLAVGDWVSTLTAGSCPA
jgi:hypothetical protein